MYRKKIAFSQSLDYLQFKLIFLNRIQKFTDFKKLAFLQCLDNLQFKCIFHKQSGSEIKVNPDTDPDPKKNKKQLDPLHWKSQSSRKSVKDMIQCSITLQSSRTSQSSRTPRTLVQYCTSWTSGA
jgi:hypothetical protein